MDIEIKSLSFAYPGGVQALQEVSLDIPDGRRLAVIGQNGAGKTTLVKHLNGLLKPGSGSVRIGEWDTQEHSVAQLAARVGYVFQNPDDQLFQSRVWDEVAFGPKNLGWDPPRVQEHTRQALEALHIGDTADTHPYDLSASRRKLVAMAAVLAMDTPIVILDEPTTGQDYATVQLIGEVVDELGQQGKTVVIITHDIDFCAEHVQWVVVMSQGQILNQGPTRQALSETDLLAQTQVEPPQMIRLAKRLDMDTIPLTVEEFIQQRFGG
jgi:energy-coupling factor transport system ATP-binding protein